MDLQDLTEFAYLQSKNMKKKYDIVIIGAGISGLIGGCYLARHGLDVLIVEKNRIVGGCYSSFKRGQFTFDAIAHIIGSCGKKGMLGSILNKLKIDVDLIELDPTDLIHFPDELIQINGEYKNFKFYLKDKFAKEKNLMVPNY